MGRQSARTRDGRATRRAILPAVSDGGSSANAGAGSLIVNVDPTPREAAARTGDDYGDVVLLVDVLRTTTTVPLLFDGGMARIVLSPSLRVARRCAAEDGALLIGERRGVPPEGFNHGNSPATLVHRRFAGATAFMVSENAPAALPTVAAGRLVMLASLVNAGAAARLAAERAERRIDIVGCGFRGAAGLDDLLTAGFLADRIWRQRPDSVLAGAARMAIDLVQAESDPLRLLWSSRSGRYLRRLGLDRDLGLAADIDRSAVVPLLGEPLDRHGGSVFPFQPHHAA